MVNNGFNVFKHTRKAALFALVVRLCAVTLQSAARFPA
jgi:hypothetical protein